jgi:hypothetical protein
LEDMEEAIALQKWLRVHVVPRVVALGVMAANRFCSRHLASETALQGTSSLVQTCQQLALLV